MNVGLVGLGIMGAPMARNLLRAGFTVNVATRTAGKAAEFASRVAPSEKVRAMATPAEVAGSSDVIVVMVTDSPDVAEVANGPEGLFAAAKAGSVVIDMSTISPAVTRDLAKEARDRGLEWIDAPVSGGEKGAIEGTLTIMVGGKKEALERVRPVLEAMGKRITYFGESGSGQSAKLCNQIMTGINILAVSEAFVFGQKAGLDLATLHQALTGGAANSWALEILGKKIIDGDFKPAFMVKLQQKDLRLVLDAARSSHTPLPGASLAHQLFASLEAEGRGDDGTQAMVQVIEKLAGLR